MNGMMHLRLMALMTAAAAMAPAAVFSYYSGFNTAGDTEGWTIKTYGYLPPGGTGPAQVAAGGYSGGYLETEDKMDGFLFFIAPGTWSGDLYGGTLSFYLRNENPGNYSLGVSPQPVLWVTNGTTNLFALRGGTIPGVVGTGWTANSIVLDAGFANWSTNPSSLVAPAPGVVAAVLSGVTQMGILADWVTRWDGHPAGCNSPSGSCVDITGLDEVRLVSAEIPEPGTLGLLGAGLAALWAWRRRAA
jgi:hypothetical protein